MQFFLWMNKAVVLIFYFDRSYLLCIMCNLLPVIFLLLSIWLKSEQDSHWIGGIDTMHVCLLLISNLIQLEITHILIRFILCHQSLGKMMAKADKSFFRKRDEDDNDNNNNIIVARFTRFIIENSKFFSDYRIIKKSDDGQNTYWNKR
jgi:hypothetical protein